MSVLCTVIWDIKPERKDAFVQTIGGMFPETRRHDGFISIRLLQSGTAENEFILVQEWRARQDHEAYVQFRAEQGDLARLAVMTAGPTLIHYWETSPLASA